MLVHDQIVLSSELETKVDAMRQRLADISALRHASIKVAEVRGEQVRLDYRLNRFSILCGSDFREINTAIKGNMSLVVQIDYQTGEWVFSFMSYT